MAVAKPIIMPKLGQMVEESTIVKWHKKEGDKIARGEVMFEIETDKAVMEVESFFDGTLLKVIAGDGVTVPVQTPVAFMGEPGDDIPAVAAPAAPKTQAKKAEAKQTSAPALAAPTEAQTVAAAAPMVFAPAAPAAPAEARISPRAKRLAREKVIKTSGIKGTGPGGRIVEKDVRAYMAERGYDKLRISPSAKRLAAKEDLDILDIDPAGTSGRIMMEDVRNALREKPVPMSKMRQVIAQRLTQSFATVPHFYVAVDVDMTDLLAYRKTLKDRGLPYSVTDFIMEAVIMSLKEYDTVNSSTDGRNVKWNSRVNLGLAVSVENGLVVPVIRRAEMLTMLELHDVAADLAVRAREGKLQPDEMKGGTFTISNMGMLNVGDFNAIINPGESAILAVSSTIQKPVVKDGKIVPRAMMNIRLSVDHRVVDGALGAEFVNSVKNKLEDVELWRSLT